MMPDKETSIVANRLSKNFGGHAAVKELSFEINKGEIVGFLGPNGAGKSTTLRILTGILPATSGFLSVCGKAVPYHPDEIKKLIGYMPENNPLPEHMRVIEYLRFRAQIKGIPFRRRKAAIERALEVCELHRKARRKIIGNLSKGFRQRVGIADAILASPAITILDEPTIGLDPHQVIAIRRLLTSLRGETTVIFSSHILSEVEITCDRVLILNQGRLVAQGTADELRKQFLPGSRYHLEVSGGRQEVMEALRKLGDMWQIQINSGPIDNFLSVNLINPNNGQNGEGILRQLMQSDKLGIRQFQAVQPSLEDIFLTATRRSWELSGDENKETEPPFPTNS
jgi:ABC-2 type transport system ATP-binding protein